MDRPIVYIGQIPLDTMILLTNKNAMISDGWIAQALLGTSTLFSGLACAPTAPATLTVNVAPGCVFSQQNVDNSPYGSISSDTTEQIMKVGLSLDTLNFSCPAPATVGQSVVYLIQAAFVEQDTGSTVLPYYNAANPAVPWSGPNNTGVSQNTMRQNICSVQVKAGTAATTGTQTTPAPDAGYTGLWAVTVAHGQTTITSGNVAQVGGAPFISETLTQKISQTTADARYAQAANVQSGAYIFANDTSGAANTITATLSPVPSGYTKGMGVLTNIANTNTGPTVINLNGLGNKTVTYQGLGLLGGELLAGQNALLTYDGTNFELNSPSAVQQRLRATGNFTAYVATTGNDSTGNGTSGAPWATIQHAINWIADYVDLNGYSATIQVADGTYTGNAVVSTPFYGTGSVTLQGNVSTPSNCIISTTNMSAILVQNSATLYVTGFKITTSGGGSCIETEFGGKVFVTGAMNFGAAAGPHLSASNQSAIQVSGNYTISGSATAHYAVNYAGLISATGLTVTLTGTPAFSVGFAVSINSSALEVPSNTFSGSATGTRYSVNANGVIQTLGAGATYLPGNSVGSTATGGQYV